MKDLYSTLAIVQSLAPAVISATSTGTAIDLQGYKSAVFEISTGAIVSSGDFTLTVEESDTTTGGDFTAVAAADLQDGLVDPLAAASVYKVGYIGTKRYIRHVLTKNSGTSIAAGINVIKGHGFSNPQA